MDTGLNGQMERRWTGGLEREDNTRGMLKDRDGDTETVFLWSEKGEMPVFPHSCYSVSNLSLHRGVPRGQISTDRWSSTEKPKTTVAVSEADELRAAGTRTLRGETRWLGDLPREEVARSEFPGTAAHAAAKGPRSSLPCDFVPAAAGRVSGNISRSALTGSRGEGNRASLAHLAFPPTPGGV